jgi:GxxExxY protein
MNEITGKIIGAAIKVHQHLGPGLLESAYEACLAYELSKFGCFVERQKPLPVIYEQVRLDCGYRLDFVIEKSIIVEIKAVEAILPIHIAQVVSYLRLSGLKLGLLLNFNVRTLKEGIRRIVNNFPESPRPLRSLR